MLYPEYIFPFISSQTQWRCLSESIQT